jgi:predicted Co/Zn/Cd cation transporter (cation efflux family)
LIVGSDDAAACDQDEFGGEGADRWLTIVFTTDEEWAI